MRQLLTKGPLKKALAFVGLTFLAVMLLLPVAAKAAGIPYWGPLLSCVGNGSHLPSDLPPCKSVCDLLVTGQNILYFCLTIALFVLLPIGLAIGGLQMMLSRGSSEGESEGRKMLTGIALALLIIMSAYVIVNTIFFFASKFTGGAVKTTWSTISCSVPAGGEGSTPSTEEKTYYACAPRNDISKGGKCYSTINSCLTDPACPGANGDGAYACVLTTADKCTSKPSTGTSGGW
jgi:hypothetical protein